MKKALAALSVALSAVLLFGATACGGGRKKKDDGTNTLELARWDIAQINTGKRQQTPIYRRVVERTGVDIKVMSVSNTGYAEKLNMLYSSEDLPDIFVTPAWDEPSTYRRWIKDGAVADLSEYVTQEKYPNVYARLKEFDFLKDTLYYADGHHYAIPLPTIPMHGLFIRTDWIENLNNKLGSILEAENIATAAEYAAQPDKYAQYRFGIPDTLPQFYRLAYAFTKYDPDGNGRNDTYGYTCCTSNMWYNGWIFEAMSHADLHDSTYWGYVETADGGIASSWVTEGNKQGVYFLNKLYQEGIMDPDYITLTEPDARTSFIQGNVGMYMENFYYNSILVSFMEAYGKTMEEAQKMFTCIVPPAGEFGERGARSNPGFWDAVCISGNLSDRKIGLALGFLDWLMSEEAHELFTWGIEGVHYKVEDGKRVSLMGKDEHGFNKTLETFDNAFPIGSFASWTFGYESPYQTNYEFIKDFFNELIAVRKHDPFNVLQPEAYVDYDLAASNNACEAFVGFISDSRIYNASGKKGLALGDSDYADLRGDAAHYTASYNSTWTDFCGKYNNAWKGTLLVETLNAEYAKHKDFYKDFFARLYEGGFGIV